MGTNTYQIGYSMRSINYEIQNQRLNYSCLVDGAKSQSNIQATFYTNNANKINSVQIFYILLEDLFEVDFYTRWLFPQENFINGHSWETTEAGLGPFNMTGGVTLWSTFVGVDAWLTGSLEIDIYLANEVPSAT